MKALSKASNHNSLRLSIGKHKEEITTNDLQPYLKIIPST